MLKVRVIPTLLSKDIGLVKGVGFDSWRRVGTLMPSVKVYNSRDVDELVVLDITATSESNSPDINSVAEFSEECCVPLTVGGGISSLDDVLGLLHAGADKVSINTAALVNPTIIDNVAARFGVQCIVASIDVRRFEGGIYHCFSHAGTQDSGRDPVELAKELVARGAGEILLTSIDRDGTMQGYDIELIERVAKAVDVPIIASGGAGNYQHMINVVIQAGASAVAAASIFHFTEQTPFGAKQAMKIAGIPIRQSFTGTSSK